MADHSKFEALHVQVLAISASNPFSQKTYADSLKLPYPLLSDHPDLQVIRQYDVLTYEDETKRPVAKGSYFLVDKAGVIRGKWMNPPGELFPNELLLQAAQEVEGSS
jgi:peroxiredoxin